MQPAIHRPTKITINRAAIRANFIHERQRLADNQKIFGVVKANAYGHGIIEVAQILHELDVDGFCVATIDEALQLRQNGFLELILVLGVIDPKMASLASDNDISVAAPSLAWLQAAVENLTQPLKVHLAVDSGMGRIGFRDRSQLIAACQFIKTHNNLVGEGLFTHFATADEPDDSYFKQQEQQFKMLTTKLPLNFAYVHCANSATSLWHQQTYSNVIRLGLALYGLNPSGKEIIDLPYPLQPALSLTSEIVYIKQMPAGQKISYGATYTTSDSEIIATIPIGYADGWLRRLSGSRMIVDGNLCPIVGRVCMDQLMIRVPKMYPVGTKVTLIGSQNQQSISATDLAIYSDTINYEILCLLSDRIPRNYVH